MDPNQVICNISSFQHLCESNKICSELIVLFLKNKANINQFFKKKNSPLHLICNNVESKANIIQILIENKAEINSKNYLNQTPLFSLVSNESVDLEMTELLLENKSDINHQDNHGKTALHYLFNNVNAPFNEIIESFTKHKADTNIRDSYYQRSFFHLICKENKTRFSILLPILLQSGADPNLKNKNGRTPFYMLCKNGFFEDIYETFITDFSADSNIKDKNSMTPFHHFCKNEKNNEKHLQFFLINKADPNIKEDYLNNTPFHYFLLRNVYNTTLINHFFQNKADPNILNINRSSVFHLLFKNNKISNKEVLLFLEHSNPNISDFYNRTPFYFYCEKDIITNEIVSNFFQKNCDPNLLAINHSTPFLEFSKNRKSTYPTLRNFFRNKADPNFVKKKKSFFLL